MEQAVKFANILYVITDEYVMSVAPTYKGLGINTVKLNCVILSP